MTTDLALIAERRGGLAALLGILVLEEPGPGLADLVSEIPTLAPLATADPNIASEYERCFLRGVPLYESVFRSDDGQRGGETISVVVDRYDRLGFTEHRDRRWRIDGPDHLGLQLRCLAHLCQQEAAAWRHGTPDLATELVEAERDFVAHHLATWAPVAVDSAMGLAGDGPYGSVLRAIADHLNEEFERLRPAPDLDAFVPSIERLPLNLGPSRLCRLILSPSTCGTWMDRAVLAKASQSIGAAWRPSDTRSALRHVISDAESAGDLGILLMVLAEFLSTAVDSHHRAAEQSPGNAANARRWARVAETMRDWLHDVAERGMDRRDRPVTETVSVSGSDSRHLAEAIDQMIIDLRQQGLCVTRHAVDEELCPDGYSALA